MPDDGQVPAKRAGLIVNPSAGKGSGKGLALAESLRGTANVHVRIIENFGALGEIVRDMAQGGVTELFISSGDGTIQEILTLIAEEKPFAAQPRICLLPHGTTNLSANDLGFRRRSLAAQANFITALAPAGLCARNTIRCANPGDHKVRHGMFVGTGAVAVATLYCQQAFNEKGVKGQWAVAGTLLAALRKYFFSARDPEDESRFDHPYPISVTAGGEIRAAGPLLLHMSTTLERLVLGVNPFWGERTGPIRTTLIPYPVPSVARWMLPVMYGGENRQGPPGSASFSSRSLEVSSGDMFVIDGEFFPPPQGEPLRLEAGPSFDFMRG